MRELGEIYAAFFKIGALTFGGGYTMLAILQQDVVRKFRWVTDEELIDFYAISQSLPGLIGVTTAMLVGYRKKKFPGLAAAAFGVACPSVLVILFIAMFIQNFLELRLVQYAFNGIRVAVAALIIHTALAMWKSSVKDKTCLFVFMATLLVFLSVGVSPILPVVAGAAVGMAVHCLRRVRKT
ncbi:MAG: chromate transporter [Synergistaceae bacterium]|nr:chromate transporter [Synergistaceae bacterium]